MKNILLKVADNNKVNHSFNFNTDYAKKRKKNVQEIKPITFFNYAERLVKYDLKIIWPNYSLLSWLKVIFANRIDVS